MNEYQEKIDAMWADADFMAWLAEYFPHGWQLEYTGDLLGMHAAWNAGRAKRD